MESMDADQAITSLIHLGVLVGLCALFALADRRVRWGWVAVALFVYLIGDAAVSMGYGALPDPYPAARWNWSGMLLLFSVMLIIAALPSFGWARVGLTTRQKGGLAIPILVVAAVAIPLVGPDLIDDYAPSNPETIAFQLTMPGLSEELFFRGVLLLALNEAFRSRITILGAPIGWGGFVTAVMFGVAHGFDWRDGGLVVGLEDMLWAGVPGVVLLWLRERTGSLLLPIVAHNLANGLPNLF